jgi:hypothetical protein
LGGNGGGELHFDCGAHCGGSFGSSDTPSAPPPEGKFRWGWAGADGGVGAGLCGSAAAAADAWGGAEHPLWRGEPSPRQAARRGCRRGRVGPRDGDRVARQALERAAAGGPGCPGAAGPATGWASRSGSGTPVAAARPRPTATAGEPGEAGSGEEEVCEEGTEMLVEAAMVVKAALPRPIATTRILALGAGTRAAAAAAAADGGAASAARELLRQYWAIGCVCVWGGVECDIQSLKQGSRGWTRQRGAGVGGNPLIFSARAGSARGLELWCGA